MAVDGEHRRMTSSMISFSRSSSVFPYHTYPSRDPDTHDRRRGSDLGGDQSLESSGDGGGTHIDESEKRCCLLGVYISMRGWTIRGEYQCDQVVGIRCIEVVDVPPCPFSASLLVAAIDVTCIICGSCG
jgi:hypothetical protein